MLLIFSKVFVVFVYIGIGFAANRLRVLPDESTRYFNTLITEITVPCMMISSIASKELDEGLYRNTMDMLIISILIYAAVCILSLFVSDHLFSRYTQSDRNVLAVAMTSCNSGFMGFPITRSVFGSLVFYYVVIQNIASNLYMFVMSIAQLHYHENRGKADHSLKAVLKPFANISTITTFIALGLLFAQIQIPEYVMDIFTTVGDVTIPLSMIMVGIQLGGTRFTEILRNKDLMVTAIWKLMLFPALVTLAMAPLPVDNVVKLSAVICTCFPAAVLGVAIAEKEERNARLMAEAVAVSTILSLITLPIWILIASHLYL